ncbi:MAG: winged helix-turn-helix domain-containing protein, partial [Pseudomonadota bacterium]
MSQSATTFRLGEFRVSPDLMEVSGPNGPQSVQPTAMRLLLYLADRAGQTVSRDELLDRVWPNTVVGHDSLHRAVGQLRTLFSDDRHDPQYIKTVPSVGYRLLKRPAPVAPAKAQSVIRLGVPSSIPTFVVGVLGGIGIVAFFWLGALDVPRPVDATGAVLLADITVEDEHALLGRNIRTALRQGLGQSPASYVVPEPQVFTILERMLLPSDSLSEPAVARRVAERLGATAVVIGQVAKVADSFSVSLEVLDPATGASLFASSFPFNTPQQMLRGLDKAAKGAAKALAGGQEFKWKELTHVTTAEISALDAFSKADRLASEGRPEEALALFEEAVGIDPEFALAHARVATILLNEDRDPVRRAESLAKALANPDRLSQREWLYIRATAARQHDAGEEEEIWRVLTNLFPADPVGHASLGKMRWRYHNDFAGAADHFRASLALVESSIVRFHLAYMLMGSGEVEESLAQFKRSVEQSSSYFNGGMADALLLAGEAEAARTHLETAQQAANEKYREWAANKWLGLHLGRGDLETALDVIDERLRAQALTEQPNLTRQKNRNALLAAKAVVLERLRHPDLVEVLTEVITGEERLLVADFPPEEVQPVLRLAFLGKLAARAGMVERAEGLLATLQAHYRASEAPLPLHRPALGVLAGEIALARGKHDEALRRIEAAARESTLLQHHESLAMAYEAAGQEAEASTAWQWIDEHRGQAAAEWYGDFYLKPRNLLDV